MSPNAWIQFLFYMVVLLATVKPLGAFMAAVYQGKRTFLSAPLGWLERLLYRLCGVEATATMSWRHYALAMLSLNVLGAVVAYVLQRVQAWLPLNPQGFGNLTPDLAFNTAASFATNTNWQSYGGESTMSYFTQMVALTVQNFLSAATGMAVLIAMIRGFAGQQIQNVGNFWVDLVRSVVYVLLPLSLVFAVILVSQGVVQTFSPYSTVPLVESITYDNPVIDPDGKPKVDAQGKPITEKVTAKDQTIPLGPAASQIAIKQLGTNGGGFFNVNSAHPFENPTPLSNFLEMVAILLIPGALCYTFGCMVDDRRQGWALLAAMTVLLVAFMLPAIITEESGNPMLAALGVDQAPSALQSGGNMEGKEARFGVVNSAIWATATTAASNGSVNSMHDSFTPLGGFVPLWMLQMGEVVYGGVGSGLYGLLAFAIVAVFVAGLMVGRTPEYLGKKIESYEMKMASLVLLIPCMAALIGTAVAVASDAGKAGVANPGAHGFTEILYSFCSAAGNNGSAFAGLSANTPFYNLALAIVIWVSRYWLMVPILAIAGSLAAKKRVPPGAGTLPTHTPLFVGLLIGTVVIVGALTFVPALALGPVVEHLQMIGR